MSKFLQFFDPWGYIILPIFETTLKKYQTKLQNLILYNTNPKFLSIMAKVRMTNYFLITLNPLDPTVEK